MYDLTAKKVVPADYPAMTGNVRFYGEDERWLLVTPQENNKTNRILIDLNNPLEFHELAGHTDVIYDDPVFVEEHLVLFTFGFDGTIRIWDLEHPAEDPIVLQHGDEVKYDGVRLSQNGKWIMSNTLLGNTFLWRWDINEVHDMACELVGRNLTLDEWKKYIGSDEDKYQKTCPQWPEPGQ